jgi:hypothetical protein
MRIKTDIRPACKIANSQLGRHERVRCEAIHLRGPQFDLIKLLQADLSKSNRRFPVKHPMISAIAAVALLAATTMLWSHTLSTKMSARTTAMPSLQDLHAVANANKLPNQEIEDQSLIYPSLAKP